MRRNKAEVERYISRVHSSSLSHTELPSSMEDVMDMLNEVNHQLAEDDERDEDHVDYPLTSSPGQPTSSQRPVSLPASMEDVMDMLNEVNHQLAEDDERDEDHVDYPLTSSPGQPTESHVKFSTPSPSKRSMFSPKTTPHWVEDIKSLLQMLCQQVESLKNEVHDLRLNSPEATASSYRMYRDNYPAEGLQEGFPGPQAFHGAPLTVATTGPSVYYNQSPAYNSQYLLRTAANVTPTKVVEEEEEMFCKRAKLFRFDPETKEWKERGIGSLKILKHRTSGKVRLLMRREQVLKICANHYITADMVLKPNAGSDKSWVWYAMDYADEMPKTEQLAIRFKTADEATLFKFKFEEAQKFILESPQGQQLENKNETPKPQVSSKEMDLKTLFSKKQGEWDCDVCCVRNAPTSAVCVACNSAAPSTAKEKPVVSPHGQQLKKKCETPKPQVSSKEIDLKTLFSKKQGEWDCDVCCVRNAPTSAVCVACNSAAPSTAKIKPVEELKGSAPVAPPAKSFSFGLTGDTDVSSKGLAFGSPISISYQFGSNDSAGTAVDLTAQADKKTIQAEAPQHVKVSATPVLPLGSGFGSQFVKKEGQWDFDSCFMRNDASATECVSCKAPCSIELAAMFGKKGQWDCDTCLAKNEGTTRQCVSCQAANPNMKGKTSTAPSRSSFSFSFGSSSKQPAATGFTANFNPGPAFQFGTSKEKASSEGFKFVESSTSQADKSSSSVFSFSMAVPAGGFKFGIAESEANASDGQSQNGSASDLLKNIAELHREKEKESSDESLDTGSPDNNPLLSGKPDSFSFAELHREKEKEAIPSSSDEPLDTGSHDNNPLITGKPDFFSFADLATCSQGSFQFGQKDPTFKGFAGAGQQLFTAFNSTSKTDTSADQEDEMYKTEDNDDIQFEPVVQMPEKFDLVTGEEDEKSLYSQNTRAPEIAEESKPKFEECQRLLLDIPLQIPHKLVNTGRTAQLIQKAEEIKSGLKDLKSFLTFQSKDDESSIAGVSTSSVTVKLDSESTTTALEWDIYDLQEEALDNYADSSVCNTSLQPDPVGKSLFRFGESSTDFSFSFQPILSPSKSPSKLNQSQASVGTDDEQEASQEEERDGQYFEPVVPLPDLVEVSTGEENEQVIFSHRAKLYRYDKELSQWKERGIGDLKILQNYETKRVRLVMRRDQVLKLCANHWIASNMNLEPMKGSEKAWIWSAFDFAEGQGKIEQLAVRFKLEETARMFKEVFEEAKAAQEKDTLLTLLSARVPAFSQEPICGKAAVAVLEETTKERTVLPEVESSPKLDGSPGAELGAQVTKTPKFSFVSPPKFVFGSDSVEKIFGSPLSSKEKSPVMIPSLKDEETSASRLKTSGQEVTSQPSIGNPFSIPTNSEGECVFADSEVTLVWEKKPTADEEQRARRLKLPPTFLCNVSSDSDSERPDDFSAELHTLQHAQVKPEPSHDAAAEESPVDGSVDPIDLSTKRSSESESSFTADCSISSDSDSERPDDFSAELHTLQHAQVKPEPSHDAAAEESPVDGSVDSIDLSTKRSSESESSFTADCSISSDSDSERPDDFSAELHTLQHAQVKPEPSHDAAAEESPVDGSVDPIDLSTKRSSESESSFTADCSISSDSDSERPDDFSAELHTLQHAQVKPEPSHDAAAEESPVDGSVDPIDLSTKRSSESESSFTADCSISSDSDSERPDDFSAELHTLQHAQVKPEPSHDAAAEESPVDGSVDPIDLSTKRSSESESSFTADCSISSDSDSERPDDFSAELHTLQHAQVKPEPSHDAAAEEPPVDGSVDPIDLSTKRSSESESSFTAGLPFAFTSESAFSFAELQKTAGEFAFGKKDANFSWSNAGATVFVNAPVRTEGGEAHDEGEEGSDDESPRDPL
ncbi:E3 SUMO-protein ligase RanBP2 [Pimephales promelas]|uniref:E3 SUMO-protein ligase RanBP2 n=1 Tax=Pimephales promelas TaxID=90988 RepID=UPI0019555AEC|nr:E3 SUMO-protein ligase RanBP2 [Pimephales promelas]